MATTADDVWRLLGELTEAQQETERRWRFSTMPSFSREPGEP